MRALIIGGTGTIGTAVVKQLAPKHEVLNASRKSERFPVDITSSDSIHGLFEATGQIDAVVFAAGVGAFKPLDEMSDDDYALGLDDKLMGQVNVVRLGHPYVRDQGSFTLTSGITGRQPMPGCTSYSMVNAAIEGFVRAAALELPRGIRINVVSPQWTSPTLELYGMDPALGVPPEQVALGYLESVEGTRTGTVIDAGWRYDWATDSVSIAGART